MQEEWRDVKEYEGLYQVSNFGRVKSLSRKIKYPNGHIHPYSEKILKEYVTPNGYPSVALGKDGKNTRVSVHRLVANAFIDNPDNLPQINHKDGNKQNNNIENLEWITVSNNILHAIYVLKNRTRPVECIETGKRYISIKEAAKSAGVDPSYLAKVAKGYAKTSGGFHWKYI